MDDTLKGSLLLLLAITALLGNLASAVDLEYISPSQSAELAGRFDHGTLTAADQKALLAPQGWACDMFGMRTKLQVQRGVKLYAFHRGEDGVANSGEQPVTTYHLADNALVGKSSRVQDRVRMTAKGQLISQLSLPAPDNSVIAYSLCTPL